MARGVRLVTLSDAWARRRFTVCFRPGGLSAAGERMCAHLEAMAGL
jgi:hypothetical protein